MHSRTAVFLDRDGVLIHTNVVDGRPYAIKTGDDAVIIDGVKQACVSLHNAGFLLVMVSNQPDVARGLTPKAYVEQTNSVLQADLGLDDVRVCFHDNKDHCHCRKPLPGLLTDAAKDFDIDLSRSVMVGDRWRDIVAGSRAGCRTVLIDYGYHEDLPVAPDHVAQSLVDAVPWILS